MTLRLRQYKKVYDKFLLEFLKDGQIPSYADVVARAGDDLPGVTSEFSPIYKFRPQTADAVFDIGLHNKAVQDIGLDLQILFEELSDIQTKNIQKLLNSDLFHSVHIHELNRLNSQLNALLFAISGGDENFFAAVESFDDFVHTNLENSTTGVVDLYESAALLPIGLKGSLKISLAHLSDVSAVDVSISKDDATAIGTVSGTKYGNIFADSVQPWSYEVWTPEEGPLSITFVFQMDKEEFINRITVLGHGDKPQTVQIQTSVDGVNKKPMPDSSQGIVLSDQSHIASFDFEDRLTEFIHVTLSLDGSSSTLPVPDTDDTFFQYYFGLKNISIYTTGREATATYESKPFDFSEDVAAIGKIAISATEQIPTSCKVDWLVGVANQLGEVVGSFVPITPQNRSSSVGAPSVVNLSAALINSETFVTTPNDIVNILDFQNIKFWNIKTITTEPVFGSAQLFRGYKSWYRDQTQSVNPVLVKDNFIPFSKGDAQVLYQVRQEVKYASVTTGPTGSNQSVLVLDKAPLYDTNKGHTLIPPLGVNPDADTDPTYAVYRATLASSITSVTKGALDFLSGPIDLGLKNISYSGPGDIILEDDNGPGVIGNVYVDGYDYIVELDDDGNPTGLIHALVQSTNDTGPPKTLPTAPAGSIKVTYTVDPDLTRFVDSVAGKQVHLDLNVANLPSSQIVVKYRHAAEEVIKSSIKAKGLFGAAGNSQIFTQGQDYVFDPVTSTIQRLTTGAIQQGVDLYVDFKYNDLADQLDQFFIWGYVNKVDGINVKVEKDPKPLLLEKNLLNPDVDAGEELLAQIPDVGLVSLTNALVWPEMKGWVQFVVRSLPPEDFQSPVVAKGNKEALINQIIKLKDEVGDFVFIQGGKYFEELTGIREPLTQVSFNHLKTNVLKSDDSHFAMREIVLDQTKEYQTVVNFKPNESTKLYSFSAVGDGSVEGGIAGVYPVNEEWRLKWTNKESVIGAYQHVIVKCILSRQPEASGGNITPKVFDYFVKVGF